MWMVTQTNYSPSLDKHPASSTAKHGGVSDASNANLNLVELIGSHIGITRINDGS